MANRPNAGIEAGLRRALRDIADFSTLLWPRTVLRPYQLDPARAIARAVRRNFSEKDYRGPNQFAIVFSRQAGKDEMTAQLLAYLLNLFQLRGGQIVMAAPTARQVTISKSRLLDRMNNPLNRGFVRTREGYVVGLGKAEARFLSAAPTSNAHGETASLLLVANETQDILPERWDAVFDPMASSTNATTLFLGTVWTASTLLARQMRHLRDLENQDGHKRLFLVGWQEVARYVPNYGKRVKTRIAQFGESHPFIQTEYFLKELDGNGGLFGPERRALMVGTHPRQQAGTPGKLYALLVDVAGESETLEGAELRAVSPRKDSTAVTVVEVEPPRRRGLTVQPTYRVVQRYVWTGVKHPALYGRLVGLAQETWQARWVVVDATGVGAAVASFLDKALPRRVIPFVFSSFSKSELGWNFCGVIDSGRFKDYADDGAADTAWWWRQLAAVEYEVRPGPGQVLRWSVPDPNLHDDLVMSAALVAVLDEQDWRPRRATGTGGE
ncbi:MAG: hypothetical protein J0I20_07380 [Chloroflexi bacterium]|nr:hypothetical protein [Chloroflexota bacterium]